MGGPLQKSKDLEIQDLITLGLQVIELLAAQGAVDAQQRQRVTVDSFATGLNLPGVTSVGTVTTVTNITSIGGWDVRQYENPANLLFNSQITQNLVFG